MTGTKDIITQTKVLKHIYFNLKILQSTKNVMLNNQRQVDLEVRLVDSILCLPDG